MGRVGLCNTGCKLGAALQSTNVWSAFEEVSFCSFGMPNWSPGKKLVSLIIQQTLSMKGLLEAMAFRVDLAC